MEETTLQDEPPARMVAGALAHLAKHMETGCPRAAYLAAMLLERVATDPEADGHLREHARELVDILDRDTARGHREQAADFAATTRFPTAAEHPTGELPARKTA
ncbi:MAG: hypothetical protein C0522_04840 [Rhodocyclaceae bacterium]|jgi:hypothetical protein|nr:hypothetical protein [Rhodocyclaceae bacterium]